MFDTGDYVLLQRIQVAVSIGKEDDMKLGFAAELESWKTLPVLGVYVEFQLLGPFEQGSFGVEDRDRSLEVACRHTELEILS